MKLAAALLVLAAGFLGEPLAVAQPAGRVRPGRRLLHGGPAPRSLALFHQGLRETRADDVIQ